MLKLLDGFRILDLCRLAAGATTKLADLGAEVIKVEEPPYGDYLRGLPPIMPDSGVGLFYEMINRNKKSLGLNLKAEEGRKIFFELLQTADAVVEISKPGTFERIGLDHASLRQHQPDLVYCSITGYGQTGPYRGLPSHGMNIDAAAGLLEIDHRPGQRPELKVGSAQGLEMGSTHAALGVLAALLRRSRTGEGCFLDVACWEGGLSANRHMPPALNLPAAGMEFEDPLRPGGPGPKYNVYGTKDDKVVLICPIEKKFWTAFCAVVGHDEWIDRGHYGDLPMDYGQSDPALRDDIEAVMRTRTRDEWIATLLAADIPVSPVLTADELVEDPHVAERGMVVADGQRRYVRLPLVVDGQAAEVALPAPVLGSHTAEILAGLGYDAAAQTRLQADGVIAGPA